MKNLGLLMLAAVLLIPFGSADILLVTHETNSTFNQTLSELSFNFSEWNIDENGPPNETFMSNYDLVIWSNGDLNNLSDDEISLLADYASKNGNLFLEGAEIASDFNPNTAVFLAQVFNSTFDHEIAIPADINYSANLTASADLPNLSIGWCYAPDALATNATAVLEWDDGSSAMVAAKGNAVRVFLPFAISCLEKEKRKQIISDVIDWCNTRFDFSIDAILNDSLTEDARDVSVLLRYYGEEINLDANPDINITIAVYENDSMLLQKRMDGIVNSDPITIYLPLDVSFGEHELTFKAITAFPEAENYTLNNVLKRNVTILPNADFTIDVANFSLSNNALTAIAAIQNLGVHTITAPVLAGFENQTITNQVTVGYNETKEETFSWDINKNTPLSSLLMLEINPANQINESNYLNNKFEKELFLTPILIISDDDANNSFGNSTADIFKEILEDKGYAVEFWAEKEKGLPSSEILNKYQLIIWSSGNYWDKTLDGAELELLKEYDGNILIEGADIMYDNANDSSAHDFLGAELKNDIILIHELDFSNLTLGLTNHTIFENITSITISGEGCPFPDSLNINNGTILASWPDGGAALTLKEDSTQKILYMAFSISALDEQTRETLILNAIQLLMYPPVGLNVEDLAVNESEMVVVSANATGFNLIYSINDSRFSQHNNIFEWQTGYDDAGYHSFLVSATDGRDTVSKVVNVDIANVYKDPIIEYWEPSSEEFEVEKGQSVTFKIRGHDYNSLPLRIYWDVDGNGDATNTTEFSWTAEDPGNYEIGVTVFDDGSAQSGGTFRIWKIKVIPAKCSKDPDCNGMICIQVIGLSSSKCNTLNGKCYCGGVCGDKECDSYEKMSETCPGDCVGCRDSDGNDAAIKGTCTDSHDQYNDACLNTTHAVEYICNTANRCAFFEPLYCGDGMRCSEGACVEGKHPIPMDVSYDNIMVIQ